MESSCILVRLKVREKDRIRRAAARAKQSMSAFVATAALAAAAKQRAPTPRGEGLSAEARDALAALRAAGYGEREAVSMIRRAIAERPNANAEALLAAAFGGAA